MHRIDEVLDTIIKPRYQVLFSTDASNGYWAIPINAGDEYKTGLVTPHGQYIYRRMGQGLKGACATYSQFGDMVPWLVICTYSIYPIGTSGVLGIGRYSSRARYLVIFDIESLRLCQDQAKKPRQGVSHWADADRRSWSPLFLKEYRVE